MSIVSPSVNGNSINGSTFNGSAHKNGSLHSASTNGNGNGTYELQPNNRVREVVASQPTAIPVTNSLKNSWVMSKLPNVLASIKNVIQVEQSNLAPRVGDCVLVRVSKVGNHSRLFTQDNQYSRIYTNDLMTGVLGARYATDAYHATKIDLGNLHMLTNGGLLGTVCDAHTSMKNPTKLELVGFIVDESGSRVNYKDELFRPAASFSNDINPVFTVGTGMNSGKTTSTARLGQALVAAGHKVAILKLTGSASHRDIHEFNATGAAFTADFSDYGFPSTYLASLEDLEGLYCRMLTDVAAVCPDVVLIEIADGVYQRETEALLNSKLIKSTTAGVVLTAACAASGIAIDSVVKQMGWDPIAVTGLITNAPLFVQEFAARSETPVCDTGKGIQETCRLIMSRVRTRKLAAVATCV